MTPSAHTLAQPYYTMLDDIFKHPTDLREQLVHMAEVAAEALIVHQFDGLRTEVLKNLSHQVTGALLKKLPKDVSAGELINIIEALYDEDAPFAGIKLAIPVVPQTASPMIAALHYLTSQEFEATKNYGKMTAPKLVALIAFEGKKNWSGLKVALNDVDQARHGSNLLANLPDLLENFHTFCVDTGDAFWIQRAGGIERIKAVGADLEAVCQAVMSDLKKTDLNEAGFPPMYEFLKTATADLQASGRITKAQAEQRYCDMLEGTLHALTRKKNHKHDCWEPILRELASFANSKLSIEHIVQMGRYLKPDQTGLKGHDVASKVKPERLKTMLEKNIAPADRFLVVERLGLEDMFTTQELSRLRGQRLEGELGL